MPKQSASAAPETRPMATAVALRLARELITKPECWTQGFLARRADGRPCLLKAPPKLLPRSKHHGARSFSIMGAILYVSRDWDTTDRAVKLLRKVAGCDLIEVWNSSHTHEEVLALLDQAIAASTPRIVK